MRQIANKYELIAASQTDQALGATGKAGDILERLIIVPETTGAGTVAIQDGDATAINVLVTGTLTAGSDQGVGFGATSGRLAVASTVAVGATMLGVYLTESVSASGVRSVAKAVLSWPRLVSTQVPY